MNPPKINLTQAALVLIDLQQGIVGMELAPHTGSQVVAQCAKLADCFRQAKSPVVLVHVNFSQDGADALKAETDIKPNFKFPANWAEFVSEIGPRRERHHHHQAPVGRVPRHRARPPTASARHQTDRTRWNRNQLRRGIDRSRGSRARVPDDPGRGRHGLTQPGVPRLCGAKDSSAAWLGAFQ